jgi:hypothetical protein
MSVIPLPPLEALDCVPTTDLPAVAMHLAAMTVRVAARLAAPPSDTGPDSLIRVREAAALLGRSEDWLYKNADRLPFTRRDRRSLRFSSAGIRRYMRGEGV